MTEADATGRVDPGRRPVEGLPADPAEERAAALRAGLEAYERGDFFLAHELLEPAWMGTADPAERAFLQGLIKLAAADVHGVRGNPTGVARNLEGALERLRSAAEPGWPPPSGVDLTGLIDDPDDAAWRDASHGEPTDPIDLPRSR